MRCIIDFDTKIAQLFLKLKQSKIRYAILRNWEGFYSDLLVKGHNDIDVLCKTEKDKKAIIRIFGAKHIGDPYFGKYVFYISDKEFYLDLRIVGDGYYCRKWEIQMLKTKVLDEKGFYKLNNENYFYSLLYHALIHKNHMADNYKKILINLKGNRFLENQEEALLSFMNQKKYYYSISYDKFVGRYFKCSTVRTKKELSTKLIYLRILFKNCKKRLLFR